MTLTIKDGNAATWASVLVPDASDDAVKRSVDVYNAMSGLNSRSLYLKFTKAALAANNVFTGTNSFDLGLSAPNIRATDYAYTSALAFTKQVNIMDAWFSGDLTVASDDTIGVNSNTYDSYVDIPISIPDGITLTAIYVGIKQTTGLIQASILSRSTSGGASYIGASSLTNSAVTGGNYGTISFSSYLPFAVPSTRSLHAYIKFPSGGSTSNRLTGIQLQYTTSRPYQGW